MSKIEPLSKDNDVFSQVCDVLSHQLGVEKSKITRESEIVKDLNADSMDQIEIMMELEEKFGREITDEDAEKLKTVGEICDYIVAKIRA